MQRNWLYTNFILKKIISGWDKALYYFGTKNIFDYIWFIEDDVYFYNENTLQQLDNQYKDDLLSNQYSINVSKHMAFGIVYIYNMHLLIIVA